jgi:hypothetical protein
MTFQVVSAGQCGIGSDKLEAYLPSHQQCLLDTEPRDPRPGPEDEARFDFGNSPLQLLRSSGSCSILLLDPFESNCLTAHYCCIPFMLMALPGELCTW